MNHLSPIVAQELKCFVRWMTHEDRPYELHDDFLATLTRERYLKFRHMHALSFSSSSPSHHEPTNTKSRKDLRERHSSLNKKKSVVMMNMPMQKSNFPLIQNQRTILHIQFISHHLTPRCHKSLSYLPTSGKHLLRAPNRRSLSITRKSSSITLHHTLVRARLNLTLHWVSLLLPHNKFINIHRMNLQKNHLLTLLPRLW